MNASLAGPQPLPHTLFVSARWAVLYDGNCRICTRGAAQMRAMGGDKVDLRDFQDPKNLEGLPEIPYADLMDKMQGINAPNTPNAPELLLMELETTHQGTLLLIDTWTMLRDSLQREWYFSLSHRSITIRLLGRRCEHLFDVELVNRLTLACRALDPTASPLTLTLLDLPEAPELQARLDFLENRAPLDRAAARQWLLGIMNAEIADLQELADVLAPISERELDEAEIRASFDTSAEGKLLHRYHRSCERELHAALAALTRLRKHDYNGPPATVTLETKPEPKPEAPILRNDQPQSRALLNNWPYPASAERVAPASPVAPAAERINQNE